MNQISKYKEKSLEDENIFRRGASKIESPSASTSKRVGEENKRQTKMSDSYHGNCEGCGKEGDYTHAHGHSDKVECLFCDECEKKQPKCECSFCGHFYEVEWDMDEPNSDYGCDSDCDDDDCPNREHDTPDVPTRVFVPREVEDDDEVADWLSDTYGWCVLSAVLQN